MKGIIILLILAFLKTTLQAQETYSVSREKIVRKASALVGLQKDRSYFIAGRDQNNLVYQLNRKGTASQGRKSAEAVLKIYYDEVNTKIVGSIFFQKSERKIRRISQIDGLTLFHGFYSVPPQDTSKSIDEFDRGKFLLEYQDIWLKSNSEEVKLKSYPEHHLDRDIEYFVSNSVQYIIVSTFVSTYLRSTSADSIINIFTLNAGKVKNDYHQLTCIECIKPQIIGNDIYYGKKFYYLKGADVYDWRIYRAPIFDLSKSELLAEYIELLFIEPEGKYAIGKKILFGKQTLVVLDLANRKFQYVLGRDYPKLKLFYSPGFRQFAFDMEKEIIYIEYPGDFPFESVGPDVKPVSSTLTDDKIFWDKFKPMHD